MSDDRGSTTIWMLGLSLLLLLFGGLALDYWRGLALQRELAAVADSAAIAGASGIDEVLYRTTGELALDPGRARDLAMASIAFQGVTTTSTEIVVAPDGSSVSVAVQAALELGLLGVFVDDDEPLTVAASAIASPVLVP
ncbi:MAG: pilus assembly protein TadG-related protein [Acidimicrobiia bacterium]